MGLFEISNVDVADGKRDGSDSDIHDAEYYAKEVGEKPEAGQSVGQWHFIATTLYLLHFIDTTLFLLHFIDTTLFLLFTLLDD